MRKFRPRSLFDRVDARRILPNIPYPTLLSELEGARTGKKPMSYLGERRGVMIEPSLLRAVFERSLAMALCSVPHRGKEPIASIFVARPAELWRVPAKLLERQGHQPGYVDASDDAYQSLLFGYTPAQTRRWIAHLDAHDDFCMYALLNRSQRRRVVALGKRCFGSASDIEQLELHYTQAPLKRDAFSRVPRGSVLARTKLNAQLLRDLFGDWPSNHPGPFATVRPTSKQARAIVAHVHRNVEFLTARGWR